MIPALTVFTIPPCWSSYSREVEHFLRLLTAFIYSAPRYFSYVSLPLRSTRHFVLSLNRRSLVSEWNMQNLLEQSATVLPYSACQKDRESFGTCGLEQLETQESEEARKVQNQPWGEETLFTGPWELCPSLTSHLPTGAHSAIS